MSRRVLDYTEIDHLKPSQLRAYPENTEIIFNGLTIPIKEFITELVEGNRQETKATPKGIPNGKR